MALVIGACLGSSQAWGQSPPAPPPLQPNPPNYDSTLIAGDGSGIAGTTFAGWAQTMLLTNGKTNVYNATFLFQQCFGGGLINDLTSVLPQGAISWTGASASTVTQPSYGPATGVEPWTSALVTQLAKPTQPVDYSADYAVANDTRGVNGSMKETGQVYNQGQNTQGTTFLYNLNEGGKGGGPSNGATNEVVVLWAGQPEGRHLSDINAMYRTLTNLWSGQNYQIYVMYDAAGGTPPAGAAWTNGTKMVNGHTETVTTMSATAANLQTLMTNTLAPGGASAMTTSTQFLFYSSDHGGFDNRVAGNFPATVPSSSLDSEAYAISAADLTAIQDSGGLPTLTITYSGLSQDIPVYWNNGMTNFLLGNLPAGGGTFTFEVPPADLAMNNTIFIDNRADTSAFTVTSKDFFSGAVDEIIVPAAIPEPSSLVLSMLGLLGTAGLIRSSRKRGTRSDPTARPAPGV